MNFITTSLAKRLATILSVFLMAGCAGTQTFNQYALSGETVAIPTGFQPDWSRDNISVWVKEQGGTYIQYPANDPRIRAVVNFYPDPLSSIVVSNRTEQDVTSYAQTYGDQITNSFTSGSRDWFQTVVFFDLPDPMNTGIANIYVEEVANTSNFVNTTVDILGTGGAPHGFGTTAGGPLSRLHLASLERASHYTVTLSGSEVPHAVQLDFTHGPDVDNGGVGKAYVVEPISGVKNISWTDDGTKLRVVVLPADGSTPTSFDDFKFYVAGGITNLTPSVEPGGVLAFNINGGDVTISPPTVTAHDIVVDEGP